ncbi:MAG: hydantoinase/oxoprolinase family protein [Chloroflexota bacterium]|nr:hydantoinase/oxoprolinase family protein [Chloroflexota bacterium]
MTRVGVDAGGTFTDVCLMNDAGDLTLFKLPSTPADPSEAIANGVGGVIAAAGVEPADVTYLGHGTTVATNALLEGRGAATGVITTRGFRDLLELGRQRRPDLYDLQTEKAPPLVRRALRLDVPERVLADGTVRDRLDLAATREAVRTLKAAGVDAIAVCFLYSYLRPEHEEAVAAIVAEEFPDAYLSLSHEVLAEFREYERLSTTVVNSTLGPVMSRYINRLRQRMADVGIGVTPFITQSNGGIISLDAAATTPVRTVLSGPAAGVVGAAVVTGGAGYDDLITFDMGGTSTDVALVEGGRCSVKQEQAVAGYPIRTPMLDITTVGAGGGSIAWIDSGGHLKVGPRSAGADPGPACYDRGGTEATVTDANVTLGILNRDALLGGKMPIDAAAADAAVGQVAAALRLAREEVAQGILAIVTANMARAIRVISVERGYDPRDYALVAFGGAGPLHAARLARELEMPRVVVPPVPGLLCALGLLVADLRTDFSRTRIQAFMAESLPEINASLAELSDAAQDWFDQEKIVPERRRTRRLADLRYVGQNYELSIDLPEHDLGTDDLETVLTRFHVAHDQAYGYAAPDEPVQAVTLRLEATGIVPTPELRRPRAESVDAAPLVATRRIWLPEAGGWSEVPVIDRWRLPVGSRTDGPAVIEQMDATTLVLPGQRAEADRHGNLIICESTLEAT